MTNTHTALLTPGKTQKQVLQSGPGAARNNPDADIAALAAHVCTVGTAWDAYKLDRDIHGTSTPALQAKVLEIGTGQEAFFYASSVPNADIPALQAKVLEVGTAEDNCCFAALIPGADVPALQARVLSVGSAFDLLQFAVFVRLANVETLYAHAQAEGFSGLKSEEVAEFEGRLVKYRTQRQQAANQVAFLSRCRVWVARVARLVMLSLSPERSELEHKMRELPRMYVEIRYARKRAELTDRLIETLRNGNGANVPASHAPAA